MLISRDSPKTAIVGLEESKGREEANTEEKIINAMKLMHGINKCVTNKQNRNCLKPLDELYGSNVEIG